MIVRIYLRWMIILICTVKVFHIIFCKDFRTIGFVISIAYKYFLSECTSTKSEETEKERGKAQLLLGKFHASSFPLPKCSVMKADTCTYIFVRLQTTCIRKIFLMKICGWCTSLFEHVSWIMDVLSICSQ